MQMNGCPKKCKVGVCSLRIPQIQWTKWAHSTQLGMKQRFLAYTLLINHNLFGALTIKRVLNDACCSEINSSERPSNCGESRYECQ
jgi:hypothetical protein